ncbi:MAG: DsrE family protein [Candidatus Wenzhouxiangella sp. M2_3B_020]
MKPVLTSIAACCAMVAVILVSVTGATVQAQMGPTGPVVEEFGPSVKLPDDAFNLVPGKEYRVLFDVASGSKKKHKLNKDLESVARFLNMHARAGIDPGDLRIEVVTHGGTTFDVLSDAAYRERFGQGNPNAELVQALVEAGVVILQCGQSAAHHGVEADEFAPGVDMAVSAMTVLVRRQEEGWVLLP